MARSTHYGICQACGGTQKLPNGNLSNHGYTVKWGFFQGTCPGSKKAPFEESCELIERFIEGAKTQKQSLLNQIEEIKANKTNKSWYHHYVTGRGGGYRLWKEVEVVNGLIKYEVEKPYEVSAIRLSLYGNDEEIAKKLGEIKIKWLEKQIKQVEEYIAWQEGRIKDWKPQPLTPIKED